jgi:pimeloyl-ACP methyl ester carboxylesterase
MKKGTFVLVPGAWHGRWCWERVTPLLEQDNFRVLTPELVGMGEDRARAATASVDHWGKEVAELCRAQSEPVTLVGHSRGGLVISAAAQLAPEHICTLVYVTAFLLPTGMSIIDANIRSSIPVATDSLVLKEDGTCTLVEEAIEPGLYNMTMPEWVVRAKDMLGPEPMSSFVASNTLTNECFGRVPRAYVECTLDQAIPHHMQRAMQADYYCSPVIAIEADHSPFFSKPGALAKALTDIALMTCSTTGSHLI